jgi:D-alanine-D-alanine ligase
MSIKHQETIARNAGTVVVLLGGASAEREISILGGNAVLAGLIRKGVHATAIDSQKDLVNSLLRVNPDRVFNMLHGRGGEDGLLQGLLEYMGIPYTGSGVLGSALAMDKVKSKLIFKQLGLSTADFVLLHEGSDWSAIIARLGRVVIKPANEGSSIGITIAATPVELEKAFRLAKCFDTAVLAEKYISGEEYTVAILKDQTLPAIQLKTDHEFYDYDAKYLSEETQYICPVDLPAKALAELNALSLAAFRALGCEGWGRVDVMRDAQGVFYLLEVNTVPGMTSHSLVPMAAKQAGLKFDDLLLEILFAKDNPAVAKD